MNTIVVVDSHGDITYHVVFNYYTIMVKNIKIIKKEEIIFLFEPYCTVSRDERNDLFSLANELNLS